MIRLNPSLMGKVGAAGSQFKKPSCQMHTLLLPVQPSSRVGVHFPLPCTLRPEHYVVGCPWWPIWKLLLWKWRVIPLCLWQGTSKRRRIILRLPFGTILYETRGQKGCRDLHDLESCYILKTPGHYFGCFN